MAYTGTGKNGTKSFHVLPGVEPSQNGNYFRFRNVGTGRRKMQSGKVVLFPRSLGEAP